MSSTITTTAQRQSPSRRRQPHRQRRRHLHPHARLRPQPAIGDRTCTDCGAVPGEPCTGRARRGGAEQPMTPQPQAAGDRGRPRAARRTTCRPAGCADHPVSSPTWRPSVGQPPPPARALRKLRVTRDRAAPGSCAPAARSGPGRAREVGEEERGNHPPPPRIGTDTARTFCVVPVPVRHVTGTSVTAERHRPGGHHP